MTNGYVGKTFSPETLQLLFSAINEDDLVDENVSLPQRIDVQCSQDSLRENYALCLQYWEEGVDRHELLHLVRELLRGTHCLIMPGCSLNTFDPAINIYASRRDSIVKNIYPDSGSVKQRSCSGNFRMHFVTVI